jgi:hypothetical protein
MEQNEEKELEPDDFNGTDYLVTKAGVALKDELGNVLQEKKLDKMGQTLSEFRKSQERFNPQLGPKQLSIKEDHNKTATSILAGSGLVTTEGT